MRKKDTLKNRRFLESLIINIFRTQNNAKGTELKTSNSKAKSIQIKLLNIKLAKMVLRFRTTSLCVGTVFYWGQGALTAFH